MRHGSSPPLNACRAFEAAARLQNFVRAAEELNVSPAAVSHQIKLLESWLGRPLFRRRASGVSLTSAGLALLPTLGEALERISFGLDSIAGRAGSRILTISTQPNFALKWLVPRLKSFTGTHPEFEIRLVTAQRSLDLPNENIDAAVRYFDALPAGLREISAHAATELVIDELLRADLMPVASPKLFPPGWPYAPELLKEQTLLHVLSSPGDWRQWLRAAGVTGIDPMRGPKFDSYALTVEAAAHGAGVAMGRSAFLHGDFASGRLTAPFALRLAGQSAWFLLTSRRGAAAKVAAFREWLLDEAHKDLPACAVRPISSDAG
ncbi:MAG TPA: LysR substrate-binding domain-containing protein [Stellaceae bacterium]|nr:LysR substrate-binding domain-containing protein [Stellaceae bacterium]